MVFRTAFHGGRTTCGYISALTYDRPKQVSMNDKHLCLTNFDVAADRTKINYMVQLKKHFISNNIVRRRN